MNCGCPIAPAYDPIMRPGATSPWSRIFSALSSWLRKKAARRPSQASVASASMTL